MAVVDILIFILAISIGEGYRSNQTVCSGNEVTLSFPRNNVTDATLVSWAKETPSHMLIASFQNSLQLYGNYRNRTKLLSGRRLLLQNTTKSDGGLYIRLIYNGGNFNDSVYLEVLEPPEPIIQNRMGANGKRSLTCEVRTESKETRIALNVTTFWEDNSYYCCIEGHNIPCLKNAKQVCSHHRINGTSVVTNTNKISENCESYGRCIGITIGFWLIHVIIGLFLKFPAIKSGLSLESKRNQIKEEKYKIVRETFVFVIVLSIFTAVNCTNCKANMGVIFPALTGVGSFIVSLIIIGFCSHSFTSAAFTKAPIGGTKSATRNCCKGQQCSLSPPHYVSESKVEIAAKEEQIVDQKQGKEILDGSQKCDTDFNEQDISASEPLLPQDIDEEKENSNCVGQEDPSDTVSLKTENIGEDEKTAIESTSTKTSCQGQVQFWSL